MGTAALGQPRESGLKSYVSRGSVAILVLVLHGALVYLLAGYLGVVRIPQPPSAEPMLASLIVQPRSLPATSRLPAMSPTDLIKPAYLPPDTPPNFRIEVPVEARQRKSLPNRSWATALPPLAASRMSQERAQASQYCAMCSLSIQRPQ